MTPTVVEARPVDPALLRTGAPQLEPNVAAPATLVDAGTGAPVLVVARYPGDLAPYRRAIRAYPLTYTQRAGGFSNISRTFGFMGRYALGRRSCCRTCAGALEAPAAHATICDAAGPLAAQLADLAPAAWASSATTVAGAVHPDWLLHPAAWWTSGVVNATSPLPYHVDGNNFKAWSAMVVLRRGIAGGHLHIPAYDAVVACRDGDVVYFGGWNLVHGVTPMRRTQHDGYRYTAVYYPVRALGRCLPADQELAYGRAVRSANEVDLVARQRSAGYIAP